MNATDISSFKIGGDDVEFSNVTFNIMILRRTICNT